MQDDASSGQNCLPLAAEISAALPELQETSLVLSVRGCGQRGQSCHYAVSCRTARRPRGRFRPPGPFRGPRPRPQETRGNCLVRDSRRDFENCILREAARKLPERLRDTRNRRCRLRDCQCVQRTGQRQRRRRRRRREEGKLRDLGVRPSPPSAAAAAAVRLTSAPLLHRKERAAVGGGRHSRRRKRERERKSFENPLN